MGEQVIHTRIWLEEPEADNPFATRAAWCHGYDVYGDMLGRATWTQMFFLLFRGEAPSAEQTRLLEALAVALANPGPRDPAVHAAMAGGTGGSTMASCLMAALAVGAGNLGGGREVLLALQDWAACGTDLEAWRRRFAAPPPEAASIWPAPEHPPGFDPNGVNTPTVVRQTLACLARLSPDGRLPWLEANREALEAATGRPLALSGVAAAALADLDFPPEEGEATYLLLRLPGAAAHALEQRRQGHRKFPFFALALEDDPLEKTP